MQKAYKLYFSANLQLVIGKVSNNLKEKIKRFLCHLPLLPPKAKRKKNQNKTKELQVTSESFRNLLLPIKKNFLTH